MEFPLPVQPEGGTVIQVETDSRSVFFCNPGDFAAEIASLRTEGGDEARIEVLHVKRPADFPGTVVPAPGASGPKAAVCHVDLVTIAPRPSLGNIRPLEIHSPGTKKVRFDERGKGTVLDESSKYFHRKSEIRSDTGDIGFGTDGLEMQYIAAPDRLASLRCHAQPHARGHRQRKPAVLSESKFHIVSTLMAEAPFRNLFL